MGTIGLCLMIGDERLGGVDRAVARPDVDAHLGYIGQPKGFSIDAGTVAAFAAITDGPAATLQIAGTDAASVALDLSPGNAPMAALTLTRAGGRVMLRDVWFSTHRRIQLRFETDGDIALRCHAFQRLPGREGLVRLPDNRLMSGQQAVIGLDLVNPYLPLLLVLLDGADRIVAADLVPFPSLVRGGIHAAEVAALGTGASAIADLAALSTHLLNALVTRRTMLIEDRLRCDTIILDVSGCTGSEPIFDGDLLDMLTLGFGMSITVHANGTTATDTVARHLIARISPPAVPASDAATRLLLPANGIPTLSVLLEPHQIERNISQRAGSFIAHLDGDGGQDWLVTLPAHGIAGPAHVPLLQAPPDNPGAVAVNAPAAILFRPAPTTMDAPAIFPVAVDAPSDDASSPMNAVSVIIGASLTDAPPLILLQSLAEQQGFDHGEILYSLITDQPIEPVQAALEKLFPGRHRIIVHATRHARVHEYRGMAGFAVHEKLLFLDPQTILHDPRTLPILLSELDKDGVATSSCLLVHATGDTARFACAGYFLETVDFRRLPSLTFDTPDTRRILPDVSAVAAVPLCAVAIRKDVLMAVPPAAAPTSLTALDEITFGLDLLRLHRSHVVTNRVSATTARQDLGATGLSASLPLAIGTDLLDRMSRLATGLQRL